MNDLPKTILITEPLQDLEKKQLKFLLKMDGKYNYWKKR